MKTNELVTMALGVVICIVIVVAVAIPIFSDTTNSIRDVGTNEQTPTFYLDEISDPSLTITKGTGKITVGTLDINASSDVYIAGCDTFTIFGNSNNLYVLPNGAASEQTSSITVGSGKITYETGSPATEKTRDIEGDFICITSTTSGTYGEFFSNTDVSLNVNEDSMIRGCVGTTTTNSGLSPSSVSALIWITGTIDDITANLAAASGSVDVDWKVALTDNGSYLTITDKRMDVTLTNTTGDYTSSPNMTLVIPMEYTYVSSQTSALSSMINIVPILLITGLLVGIIGIAVYSRS